MKQFYHNRRRAERMQKCIESHFENGDVKHNIIDSLANLRHLCDKNDLDFADLDRIAYSHYSVEQAENVRETCV